MRDRLVAEPRGRLCRRGDRAQRRGEALRVAGQLGGRRVGDVLPAAADRHLDQDRRHGSEHQPGDHGDQHDQVGAAAALAATAAEPHGPREDLRQHRDRARQHRRPGHQPHVVVADVAHLVSEDPLQLLLVEALQQAGRDAHDRLLR